MYSICVFKSICRLFLQKGKIKKIKIFKKILKKLRTKRKIILIIINETYHTGQSTKQVPNMSKSNKKNMWKKIKIRWKELKETRNTWNLKTHTTFQYLKKQLQQFQHHIKQQVHWPSSATQHAFLRMLLVCYSNSQSSLSQFFLYPFFSFRFKPTPDSPNWSKKLIKNPIKFSISIYIYICICINPLL